MWKLYIIPSSAYNYTQVLDKLFFACYNAVPWRERSGRQLNNTYLHTYFLVPPLSFRTRTYYIGTEHIQANKQRSLSCVFRICVMCASLFVLRKSASIHTKNERKCFYERLRNNVDGNGFRLRRKFRLCRSNRSAMRAKPTPL